MTETEFAEKAREAIYQGLFKFARSQGMTEVQALLYAAQWGGEIHEEKNAR